jgi:hypothetical protein
MQDDKQRKKKVMPVSPGRPKGVPNKLSGIAKDNIAEVFDRIGGVEEMALWASDNQTAFYNIYAKLLPIQVNGAGANGEHLISGIEIRLVSPSGNTTTQKNGE